MSRLILIDGNSILNRAFYGIMGNKMLQTEDGTYTNAVYGFLAIMFKIIDDLKPEYLAVAFDLKAPTKRHKLYEAYKGTRKGMPEELAMQMPLIKDILKAMNIKIIELEGYEADDILGTLSKKAEKENKDVTILSGDRDTFQLATDRITIRIPRTKMGKTTEEDFDKNKIIETYGIEPIQLIEVKGLMGDSSDNIPGVPGIGEKTALSLIQQYKSIEEIYEKLENEEFNEIKGKTKEKLIENKELAFLSKTLGTIDIQAPIDVETDDLLIKEWDKEKVLELFKKLNFNKYIQRFNLESESKIEEKTIDVENLFKKIINPSELQIRELVEIIKKEKELIYYFGKENDFNNENIIKKKISNLSIYNNNSVYYIEDINVILSYFKELFENNEIKKIGIKQKEDYILLKQIGINIENTYYDVEIAAYIIDSTQNKFEINEIIKQYLGININDLAQNKVQNTQLNLFEQETNKDDSQINMLYVYFIYELYKNTEQKLKENNQIELFYNIEMPVVEVLADMQYTGIFVDKNELIEYGKILKEKIEELTKEIYNLAGLEFNINSTKQLGKILFEDIGLTVYKKTKSGYSTDVDVLEKLKNEHPIINKLLEYRQLVKLNSTYIEGLIPYINLKDNRIHSCFHQTVTATGRISSTEPNLQNIPTRFEMGKKIRKIFKPDVNKVFIDADYSQIELRVLAHISEDETMIQAFKNNEDIHKQAASKVFNIPLEDVTKEQRSEAKAVNFGIVYGISDFGLAGQLNISRKKAKNYIDQYLLKYPKIKEFMDNIIEKTKEKGYVETIFHRKRNVPEINSKNFNIRQFGNRVALNTPIQGTAADIMKLAMIDVYNKFKNEKLNAKIILQIHDELLIEADIDEKEKVKKILKESMENIIKLKVPLIVEMTEADNWYDCK